MLGTFGQEHDECTRNHLDARGSLEHLEGGAQHIAGGVEGTSHLTIGIAVLDDEATQVERILGSGESLLHGDAFVLAQLIEEFAIFLVHGFVVGVDEGGFAYVLEAQFLGFSLNFVGVAEQYDVGQSFFQKTVGGSECTGFKTLGENDALLVGGSLIP